MIKTMHTSIMFLVLWLLPAAMAFAQSNDDGTVAKLQKPSIALWQVVSITLILVIMIGVASFLSAKRSHLD